MPRQKRMKVCIWKVKARWQEPFQAFGLFRSQPDQDQWYLALAELLFQTETHNSSSLPSLVHVQAVYLLNIIKFRVLNITRSETIHHMSVTSRSEHPIITDKSLATKHDQFSISHKYKDTLNYHCSFLDAGPRTWNNLLEAVHSSIVADVI